MPPALPRVAVIIPCHGDGALVAEAVHSVDEQEPIELVVVDDGSADEATRLTLAELEREGVQVVRHAVNLGLGKTRMTALAATSAPLVYPLDSDDLALPGVLARMADALEAEPGAAACVGDVEEFGEHVLVRRTPAKLDPYRVAYTNEYPVTALYRRSVLEAVDAYRPLYEGQGGYEDWNLWMALAERGERIVHIGAPAYRRRLHGPRLGDRALARHGEHYAAMRLAHPDLFRRLPEHRRASDVSPLRKLIYPRLFGARPAVPFERRVKPLFDRFGIWTRVAKRGRAGRAGRRRDA